MGGRLSSNLAREQTLDWAETFLQKNADCNFSSLQEARAIAGKYFALCSIARSKNHCPTMKATALGMIFNVRVKIENSVLGYLEQLERKNQIECYSLILKGRLFGSSKKQGVSLRLPLSSCVPSRLCSSFCYAHDALDATPNSLMRGAINGFIAKRFSEPKIIEYVRKEVLKANHAALEDAKRNNVLFIRRPRIRLAHVGEAAHYLDFCNFLAKTISEHSNGKVDTIVYTRHPQAIGFDQNYIKVLFSLDSSSLNRKKYVPHGAQVVYTALPDEPILPDASINFLEHHPHEHGQLNQKSVCPVSIRVDGAKSCDQAKCNVCFI